MELTGSSLVLITLILYYFTNIRDIFIDYFYANTYGHISRIINGIIVEL